MPGKRMRNKAEMEKFLTEMDFGFLGVSQGDKPYVVPMNYVYHNDKIYLHAAPKGLKIQCLNKNSQVCFTVAAMDQLVPSHEDLCSYSLRYRSVIARGRGRILFDPEEKMNALTILAQKYASGNVIPAIDTKKAQVTSVIVIEIEEMTGKYNREV